MPGKDLFLARVGATYEDLSANEIREMLVQLPWDRVVRLADQVRAQEDLFAIVREEIRQRDSGARRKIDLLLDEADTTAEQIRSIALLAAQARRAAPLDP